MVAVKLACPSTSPVCAIAITADVGAMVRSSIALTVATMMVAIAVVPAMVIAIVVGSRIIAIAVGIVWAMVENVIVRGCVPITVVRTVCRISVATASPVAVIRPAPTIPLSRGRRSRCKR
jgi:hypothetical protein